MMVTVAKSLDVPIKLMFPRPGPADDPTGAPSHAMLGLGDVVLPGIMIGLALRFDLYLYYLRKQKRIPVATSGEQVIEKPKYHSLAGRWTDLFWTHSLTGRPLWVASSSQISEGEPPFTFPKTYFKAGLVGYVIGLLATLSVMMVWNHAQPALLYLVPGVLGSLWLTALVRGELSLMWSYTEEIDDEAKSNSPVDKNIKADADGDEKAQHAEATTGGTDDKDIPTKSEAEVEQSKGDKRVISKRPAREVFSFSIEAPWQLSKSSPTRDEPARSNKSEEAAQSTDEKHNWVPSKVSSPNPGAEPAGKRVRLK